jgi:hypothetical protein
MNQSGRLAPRSSLLTELMARNITPQRWVGVLNPDDRLEPVESSPARPEAQHPLGPAPHFGCQFDFLATLTATVDAEVIGDTADGYRVNFYIKGGTVRGPTLDAELRAHGGDWMTIRPDGTGIVDVNVTYEMSDGSLILEQSGGVLQLGVDGLDRVKRGDFSGFAPYYSTPRWSTSAPSWNWLQEEQGIGVGRVTLHESLISSDIYLPRLGREVR